MAGQAWGATDVTSGAQSRICHKAVVAGIYHQAVYAKEKRGGANRMG